MQKVRLIHSVRLRALFLLLAVLWAGFIFSMSNETAPESSKRSAGLAEIILTAVHPGFADLPEAVRKSQVQSFDHILRKAAHFTAYALLGGLICLNSLSFCASRGAHLLRSLLIAALYAASDEFHQSFVPGRGPAVSDVLLDAFGALCGILFILLIASLMIKKQKNSV